MKTELGLARRNLARNHCSARTIRVTQDSLRLGRKPGFACSVTESEDASTAS